MDKSNTNLLQTYTRDRSTLPGRSLALHEAKASINTPQLDELCVRQGGNASEFKSRYFSALPHGHITKINSVQPKRDDKVIKELKMIPSRIIEIPRKENIEPAKIIDVKKTLLVGGDGDCWLKLWQPHQREGVRSILRRAWQASKNTNSKAFSGLEYQTESMNDPVDLEWIVTYALRTAYWDENPPKPGKASNVQNEKKLKARMLNGTNDKSKPVKKNGKTIDYSEKSFSTILGVELSETADGFLHIEGCQRASSASWLNKQEKKNWFSLYNLNQYFKQRRREHMDVEEEVDLDESLLDEKIDQILSDHSDRIKQKNKLQIDKLNEHSKLVVRLKTNKFKVGVTTSYLLRTNFFESLQLNVDNTDAQAYLSALADHDLRVINNTWAASDFKFIQTTKPDRRLIDSGVKELTDTTIVMSDYSLNDPTYTFLLDVCCAYSYLNAARNNLTFSSDVLESLIKQDWFEPTESDNRVLITTSPTIDDCLVHDIVYLIGPCVGLESEGYLPHQIGYYKWDVNKCVYTAFGNSTESKVHGWYANLLAGEQSYSSDRINLSVVARKTFDAMQVIVITTLVSDSIKVMEDEWREFEIPVLADSILWATDLPILKTMKCSLNKTLLKRLINKNLNGNVSKELMMEYGMALSWYSYNKRGVEVSSHKISPFDVKTHVYIARVLHRRSELKYHVQSFATKRGINATAFATIAALVKETFTVMEDDTINTIANFVGTIMDKLKSPNIKTRAGIELESWDGIDFWTASKFIVKPQSNLTVACNHHSVCSQPNTGLKCIHCGCNTAVEGTSLCVCCVEEVAFEEKHDEPESDTTMCGNLESYSLKPLDTKKTESGQAFEHTHTCVNCKNNYFHSHPYMNLNHHQTTTECPHCSYKRIEGVVKGKKLFDKEVKDDFPRLPTSKHGKIVGNKFNFFSRSNKGKQKQTTDLRRDEPEFGLLSPSPPGVPIVNAWGEDDNSEYEKEQKEMEDDLANSDAEELRAGTMTWKEYKNLKEKKKNEPSKTIETLKAPDVTKNEQPTFAEVIKESREDKAPTLDIDVSVAEICNTMPINSTMQLLGEVPMHSIYKLVDNEKLSTITFIGNNHPHETVKNFEIANIIDSNVGDCGVACLRHYVGIDYTEHQTRRYSKAIKNFSGKQISDALNGYGFNAMVIENGLCSFSRIDDSEGFAVVTLGTGDVKNADNHWMVCHAKRINSVGISMLSNPLFNAQAHDNAARSLTKFAYSRQTNKNKVSIGYYLMMNLNLTLKYPIEVVQLNQGWVTNGDKHDMQDGKINFKIKDEYLSIVEAMFESMQSKTVNPLLNEPWDLSDNQSLSIEYNRPMAIRDTCLSVAKTFSDVIATCRPRRVPVKTYKANSQIIDLSDTKLKPGDVIFIPSPKGFKELYVNRNLKSVEITTNAKLASITIYIPKQSLASMWIKLYSLNKNNITDDQLEKLVKDARIVMGYGGSGKSTYINSYIQGVEKSSDVKLVACTSGGVQSLISKVTRKEVIPISFEKATYKTDTDHKILIVDEATLIKPWELALIVRGDERLMLFGDPTQIGAIDMNTSGGERLNMNIITKANDLNVEITKWTHSYRYGGELARELKKVPQMNDLEVRSESDTKVETYWLQHWDSEEIDSICSETNLVLCFYSDHVVKLQKLFKFRNIEVTTVHGYQGKEKDTVVVIQCPLKDADTHLSAGHTLSAATRAIKKLIWISVGCFTINTPLHYRIGHLSSVAGFFPDLATFSRIDYGKKDVNVEVNASSTNITEIIEQVAKGGRKEQFNISDFNAEVFTIVLSHFTKAVQLKDVKNLNGRIEFTAGWGFINGKVTVDDQLNVTGPVPNDRKNNLIDLISWCCIGADAEFVGNICVLNKFGWYRCRIISHVLKVYRANGKSLKLKGDLEQFDVLVETQSCAACSELIFVNKTNQQRTVVKKDYLSNDARIVMGSDSETIQIVLNNEDEWNILPTYLDDINLSHAILMERFSTAYKEYFSVKIISQKDLHANRYENVLLANEIKTKMNVIVETNKYDNQNWYPFINKHLIRSKISYIERGVRVFKTVYGSTSLKELIYRNLLEMLEHYRNDSKINFAARLYMRRLGAINADRLPGMRHTIEWHKLNKTRAYTELVKRVAKMEISALKYEDDLVFVPSNVLSIIQGFGNFDRLASNNRTQLSDAYHSAADILLFASVCKHYNGIINTYCLTPYLHFIFKRDGKNDRSKLYKSNSARTMLLDNIYIDMLKKMSKHVTEDEAEKLGIKSEILNRDVWTGEPTFNSKITIAGPDLLNDITLLGQLLQNHESVFIWLPMFRHVIGDEIYYKFEADDSAYQISNMVDKCLNNGECLDIAGVGKSRVHTINTIGELRFVKISNNITDSWSNPWTESGTYVWLDVPKIIIDPTKILNEREILSTEKKRYNLGVLMNLDRRTLRIGTTRNDLLIQARTLVNTAQFSLTNVYDKYNISVSMAKDCADLAYMINEQENRLLSLIEGDSWGSDLKVAALTFVGRLLNNANSNEIGDKLLSMIPDNFKPIVSKMLLSFFEKLSMMRKVVLRPQRQFVNAKFMSRSLNNPTLINWLRDRVSTAKNTQKQSLISIVFKEGCTFCESGIPAIIRDHHLFSVLTLSQLPKNSSFKFMRHRCCKHNGTDHVNVDDWFNGQPCTLSHMDGDGLFLPFPEIKHENQTLYVSDVNAVVSYVNCVVNVSRNTWQLYNSILFSVNTAFILEEKPEWDVIFVQTGSGNAIMHNNLDISVEHDFSIGDMYETSITKFVTNLKITNNTLIDGSGILKDGLKLIELGLSSTWQSDRFQDLNRVSNGARFLNLVVPIGNGKGLMKEIFDQSDTELDVFDDSQYYDGDDGRIWSRRQMHDVILCSNAPYDGMNVFILFNGIPAFCESITSCDVIVTAEDYENDMMNFYCKEVNKGDIILSWSNSKELATIMSTILNREIEVNAFKSMCGHINFDLINSQVLGAYKCSVCQTIIKEIEEVCVDGKVYDLISNGTRYLYPGTKVIKVGSDDMDNVDDIERRIHGVHVGFSDDEPLLVLVDGLEFTNYGYLVKDSNIDPEQQLIIGFPKHMLPCGNQDTETDFEICMGLVKDSLTLNMNFNCKLGQAMKSSFLDAPYISQTNDLWEPYESLDFETFEKEEDLMQAIDEVDAEFGVAPTLDEKVFKFKPEYAADASPILPLRHQLMRANEVIYYCDRCKYAASFGVTLNRIVCQEAHRVRMLTHPKGVKQLELPRIKVFDNGTGSKLSNAIDKAIELEFGDSTTNSSDDPEESNNSSSNSRRTDENLKATTTKTISVKNDKRHIIVAGLDPSEFTREGWSSIDVGSGVVERIINAQERFKADKPLLFDLDECLGEQGPVMINGYYVKLFMKLKSPLEIQDEKDEKELDRLIYAYLSSRPIDGKIDEWRQRLDDDDNSHVTASSNDSAHESRYVRFAPDLEASEYFEAINDYGLRRLFDCDDEQLTILNNDINKKIGTAKLRIMDMNHSQKLNKFAWLDANQLELLLDDVEDDGERQMMIDQLSSQEPEKVQKTPIELDSSKEVQKKYGNSYYDLSESTDSVRTKPHHEESTDRFVSTTEKTVELASSLEPKGVNVPEEDDEQSRLIEALKTQQVVVGVNEAISGLNVNGITDTLVMITSFKRKGEITISDLQFHSNLDPDLIYSDSDIKTDRVHNSWSSIGSLFKTLSDLERFGRGAYTSDQWYDFVRVHLQEAHDVVIPGTLPFEGLEVDQHGCVFNHDSFAISTKWIYLRKPSGLQNMLNLFWFILGLDNNAELFSCCPNGFEKVFPMMQNWTCCQYTNWRSIESGINIINSELLTVLTSEKPATPHKIAYDVGAAIITAISLDGHYCYGYAPNIWGFMRPFISASKHGNPLPIHELPSCTYAAQAGCRAWPMHFVSWVGCDDYTLNGKISPMNYSPSNLIYFDKGASCKPETNSLIKNIIHNHHQPTSMTKNVEWGKRGKYCTHQLNLGLFKDLYHECEACHVIEMDCGQQVNIGSQPLVPKIKNQLRFWAVAHAASELSNFEMDYVVHHLGFNKVFANPIYGIINVIEPEGRKEPIPNANVNSWASAEMTFVHTSKGLELIKNKSVQLMKIVPPWLDMERAVKMEPEEVISTNKISEGKMKWMKDMYNEYCKMVQSRHGSTFAYIEREDFSDIPEDNLRYVQDMHIDDPFYDDNGGAGDKIIDDLVNSGKGEIGEHMCNTPTTLGYATGALKSADRGYLVTQSLALGDKKLHMIENFRKVNEHNAEDYAFSSEPEVKLCQELKLSRFLRFSSVELLNDEELLREEKELNAWIVNQLPLILAGRHIELETKIVTTWPFVKPTENIFVNLNGDIKNDRVNEADGPATMTQLTIPNYSSDMKNKEQDVHDTTESIIVKCFSNRIKDPKVYKHVLLFKQETGKREQLYTNPLVPPRFSLGRNLLSFNMIHFVDSKFGTGNPSLTKNEQDSLFELCNRIIDLKLTKSDIAHIYCMHEGVAERNPGLGRGRHICFTTNEAKYRARGFETIKLDHEPYRFGACLRLIFSIMNPGVTISKGGRVNLHGLFAERYIAELIKDNNPTENFVVMPWNTIGSYMDGMVMAVPVNRQAVRANIVYWKVYGIDEANIKWFNLKRAYIAIDGPYPYSNVGTNSFVHEIKKDIKIRNIDPSKIDFHNIPYQFVLDSTVNSSRYMKLAWAIDDSGFNVNTRNPNASLEDDPVIINLTDDIKKEKRSGELSLSRRARELATVNPMKQCFDVALSMNILLVRVKTNDITLSNFRQTNVLECFTACKSKGIKASTIKPLEIKVLESVVGIVKLEATWDSVTIQCDTDKDLIDFVECCTMLDGSNQINIDKFLKFLTGDRDEFLIKIQGGDKLQPFKPKPAKVETKLMTVDDELEQIQERIRKDVDKITTIEKIVSTNQNITLSKYDNPVIDLKAKVTHRVLLNDNSKMEITYNAPVIGDCVPITIKYALRNENATYVENLLDACSLTSYSTAFDLMTGFNAMHLNHVLVSIDEDGSIKDYLNCLMEIGEGAPTHCFGVMTYEDAKYTHLVYGRLVNVDFEPVVPYHSLPPKSLINDVFTMNLAMSKIASEFISDISNKVSTKMFTEQSQLNAKHRRHGKIVMALGRYKHNIYVSNGNNHKHFTFIRDEVPVGTILFGKCLNKNGLGTWTVVDSGIDLSGHKRIVFGEINKGSVLFMINKLIEVSDNESVGQRRFVTDVDITKKTFGWLTRRDKLKAIDYAHNSASRPIDSNADTVLLYDFDNRDHHNVKSRTIVLQRYEEGKITFVCGNNKDRKDCTFMLSDFMSLSDITIDDLKLSGPMRICIQELNVEIGWVGPGEMITVVNNVNLTFRTRDKCKFANKFIESTMMRTENGFAFRNHESKSQFENQVKEKDGILSVLDVKDYITSTGCEFRIGNLHDHWLIRLDKVDPLEVFEYLHERAFVDEVFVDEGNMLYYKFSRIGQGYMDYALKQNVSVKVDEKVLDKYNTIDDLSHPKKEADTAKLDPNVVQGINSLAVLNSITFNDESDSYTVSEGKDTLPIVMYGTSTHISPINGEIYRLPTDPRTMNYWDDETAMVEHDIELPYDNIKMKWYESFEGIKTVKKSILHNYPSHSQPAQTKRFGAGLQAVSDLFGKKLTLRQVEHDPKTDARLFAKTYFRSGASAAMPEVSLDCENTLKWLAERPDYVKVSEDLTDFLSSGMDIRGLDKVNVHMKLESRLKDAAHELGELMTMEGNNKMPETIEQQRVRLIVWQRKGIAAIFSPFFKQVKENLKRSLIDKIVYVDGMTPQQISALLNKVDGNVKFAEDDLAKQDRQTDHTVLATEMEVYKLLGANRDIVNLWHKVHFHWRAKGIGVKFEGDASRHTGQATTAIGNAIVNLLVKMRLVNELGNSLKLMMVLGDDNIILCTGEITAKQITLNSARHWNMKSEAEVSEFNGGFLRMLVYKNNVGSLECGPDIVRLRRRFEVLNGVAEANDENVKMRTMSYCMMLGAIEPVQKLIKNQKLDVEPSIWYDFSALSNNLAIKYKMTPEMVEAELANLIEMMTTRNIIDVEKTMFVGKGM